ncbi:MAG: hypothetical protein AAF371_12315 [Pseudomonadota bacterium]
MCDDERKQRQELQLKFLELVQVYHAHREEGARSDTIAATNFAVAAIRGLIFANAGALLIIPAYVADLKKTAPAAMSFFTAPALSFSIGIVAAILFSIFAYAGHNERSKTHYSVAKQQVKDVSELLSKIHGSELFEDSEEPERKASERHEQHAIIASWLALFLGLSSVGLFVYGAYELATAFLEMTFE